MKYCEYGPRNSYPHALALSETNCPGRTLQLISGSSVTNKVFLTVTLCFPAKTLGIAENKKAQNKIGRFYNPIFKKQHSLMRAKFQNPGVSIIYSFYHNLTQVQNESNCFSLSLQHNFKTRQLIIKIEKKKVYFLVRYAHLSIPE